jgi:hypothetical protein
MGCHHLCGPQKTEWELISPVITRIHAEGGLGTYMNREEVAEEEEEEEEEAGVIWGLFVWGGGCSLNGLMDVWEISARTVFLVIESLFLFSQILSCFGLLPMA